ncbi:MAG: DUF3280 domain-containing protein [Hyphomicrobium sp.]
MAAPVLAESPESPKSVALLGAFIQNDNEGLDPTSDAERARLRMLERMFSEQMASTGKFKFVPITDELRARIAAGQPIGSCSGCEVDYGKSASADLVAWIIVQKVSNLILNLNVYIGDVQADKMTFIHSVDIRGNTDESWSRSLTYLMQNYYLPSQSAADNAPAN